MDTKGDDSSNDTLDQSLLKKCVVADDDSLPKQPDAAVNSNYNVQEQAIEPGGFLLDSKDSPASPSPPPPPSPPPIPSSPSPEPFASENTSDGVLIVIDNDLLDENSSCSSREDSQGFESEVRQISDDLKDTKLGDENSLEKIDDLQLNNLDTTPEITPTVVKLENLKSDSDDYDSDRTITYESPSKKSSSPSFDRKKSLSKKVHFHFNQDKMCSEDEGEDDDECEEEGDEDDEDDDGEGEEEEEEDEEEEENDGEDDPMNADVRSKEMRIPLSFVSPHDEEDTYSDDALSDDIEIEDPPPEGGIQSILGKLSQMGKIEYLFRFVDRPGLQWESEEVLNEKCPNLIRIYEEKRAREREHDMQYILRRKKLRPDHRNE